VKALVGSEKYFLELVPVLEKKGVSTEFICIYNEADENSTILFIEAYKALGLTMHVHKLKSDRSILSAVRFIKKTVSIGKFDLIHTHLIHADFWCALLKKIYRINTPIVSTKHGYDEDYISKHGFNPDYLRPNKYYRIAKFSEKHIKASFSVSDGLKNLFVAGKICTSDKIRTIHHGFDLPEIENKVNSVIRKSKYQLVILGRIIPFKGHIHLLKALKIAVIKIPDVHLNIVGHGDAQLINQLKEFIANNNLEKNVSFEGYKSNIYDYLTNADIMIVPSISEGFGLVFLEAMNAKIPIIGFDVAATNEIIKHDETGQLVELKNEEQLAEAIVDLFDSPQKRNYLSSKAFTRLKSYFSLDRMVSQTIEFYKENL
jgi:glycosyltransferase involved in cell wall biosynthesis